MIGIDVPSRQGLFLLASMGESGKLAANDVLAKVVKKLSEIGGDHEHAVQNWSAYVHQATKTWRHAINNNGNGSHLWMAQRGQGSHEGDKAW